MNQFKNLFFLIIFWGIPAFLFYFLFNRIGLSFLTFLIIPTFITAFLISISYKHLWSSQAFKTKKGLLKFSIICTFLFLLFAYCASLEKRSTQFYKYILSENTRGWKGIVHQTDDTLGFKPIPNSKGFHIFPYGDDIPMAYSSNGFRIPLGDTTISNYSNNLDILFLGCSFTYGDACYAEETFPYLVSKEMEFSYINAGVCSYGLAHMQILSERLIPKYKPKYLVLQYSPWLVKRGTRKYAPVYLGSMPNPFFYQKDNSFSISFPFYKSQMYTLDKQKMIQKYQGKYLNFLFEKGISFYLFEDRMELKNKIYTLFGFYPKPASNQLTHVEKYAYNKIINIAKKYDTTIILLNLGDIKYSQNSKTLFDISDVLFAEADLYLSKYIKSSPNKDYSKAFHHWRFDGEKEIIVDQHPNPKAHSIIAQSIIDVLKNKY